MTEQLDVENNVCESPFSNRVNNQETDNPNSELSQPSQSNDNKNGKKHPFFSREMWIGDVNKRCLPSIPCLNQNQDDAITPAPAFIGPSDKVPIGIALVHSFQHALAMVGSIIMVPRLFIGSGSSFLNLDATAQAHVVSAALVMSGISSILRAIKIPLLNGYIFGTGLILMSGPAIGVIPIIESSIETFYKDGTCLVGTPCVNGFGKLLGTFAAASLFPIALSFVPPKIFQKICPPMVNGVTVIIISISLLGSTARMFAGGSGACYLSSKIRRDLTAGEVGANSTVLLPSHLEGFMKCPSDDGPNPYEWGTAPWIGLASFVLLIVILIEIFGTPAVRALQVLISIVAGTILAGIFGFIDTKALSESPLFTFPLVYRFPLGFYAPAFLPTLVAYLTSAVYNIAALTPACQTARVSIEGEEFNQRIQGGLLADGISILINALFMSPPSSPYMENTALADKTCVAHPLVGVLSGLMLVLFGVIGKVGGFFSVIPEPVIGGVLIPLFGSIALSGFDILSRTEMTDRNKFIIALSIGVGVVVSIEPDMLTLFIPPGHSSFTRALQQCLRILFRTSFSLSAIVAIVLNAILPTKLHIVD